MSEKTKPRKVERWALVTLPSGTVVKAKVIARPGGAPRLVEVKGYTLPEPTAIRVCPEAEPTAHELRCRAFFAGLTGGSYEAWWIIVTLGANAAADFADTTEGTSPPDAYGQAWKLADGTWGQRPHTKTAVLLHWLGPKRAGA